MTIEPPGPPSDESTPSSSEPAALEAPSAPVAEAPPEYAAPPAYAPPAPIAAAPKRGRGGLLAIILVIALLIVAGGGYVAGGFITANGKLNSSTDAYNKVTDHQNKLTTFFDTISGQFSKNNLTGSSVDSVKQEKSLFQQLVTQSQGFQPTITSDDQSLVNAEASLKDSSWLTALSKSSLDTQGAKIEDLRAALKIANTILGDYIQYGTFYASLDQAVIDFDNVSKALDAQDLAATVTALGTFKTDLATALTQDKGAGISTQMPSFIQTLQALANDLSALIAAAQAGNSAGVDAAAAALDADNSKLDKFDDAAMQKEEQTFYKQLIDSYNSAVDKANRA